MFTTIQSTTKESKKGGKQTPYSAIKKNIIFTEFFKTYGSKKVKYPSNKAMYEALATTLSARDNYATEFPERNFAEVAKGGDALSRLVLEVFAGYRQYFDGLKQLEESTTMPVDVHEYVSVSVCVCVSVSVCLRVPV